MAEYKLYNATNDVDWSKPISSHKSINAARKAAKQKIGKSKTIIAIAYDSSRIVGMMSYTDGSKYYKGERAKIHTGWFFNSFRKPRIKSGWVKTDGSVEDRFDPYYSEYYKG